MEGLGLARPRLSLLAPAQIEAVHAGSLRILRELGLRVDSERARLVFAKAGKDAHVEGDRVRLERDVVEWAIKASPRAVDVYGRRGNRAFRLGEDRTRFGVGVTNLWYQDEATDALSPFSRAHM